MRFNLETSKLLYEVSYQNPNSKDDYTNEKLYKDKNGEYCIHFRGGKYSKYAMKVKHREPLRTKGSYFINQDSIELWKSVSKLMQEEYPNEFIVTDWEKEEKESLLWMNEIAEEELPF